MNTGYRLGGRLVATALGIALACTSSALAHNDPPGCSATGVSIEVRVFRMDGVTGVVGAVSQCEDINYQVVIKKSSAAACAFSGGTLTLTLPDGSMNQISGNVPCIGGTTSPCDPTVTELDSALIPYTIKTTDIHSGFILATAVYANGVAHDNEPDTPGVGANTPKQTPAVLCTDNNLCTNDFCDSTVAGAAACSHTPVNCDDNNACTADTCNATNGLCEHGAPPSCDDNNACTADSCNTTTGLCEHGAPPNCDDGNACTADSCNTTTGLCQHGAPPSCDDGNACTADSCNTTTGLCEHGAPPNCDDGNACTADSCNTTTGLCEHGAPPNCDDGNACTTDSCNTTTGLCQHVDNVTPTCDDNNACTNNLCDTVTGQCTFPPKSINCNDNNACTTDSCNTATGACQHVDNVTPTCNDNNPCTDDSCNTTSGLCQNVPNDNPACAPAICRTPGFWGTHGGVSLQVIGLAGGCLDVCGEVIKDINVNSADSVLEAICVSPRGEQRLQLARQLTSMALNCVISGFGSDCGGNANLDLLFGSCNSSCLGLPNSPSVGDCISAVDCFNNGGSLDAQGLCEFDDNNNCHNRALPATLNQGPADTPQQCNSARKNACEIILSGEQSCATGTKSAGVETCP
jgi:hypothetical protein